jgi:hypothetical protein
MMRSRACERLIGLAHEPDQDCYPIRTFLPPLVGWRAVAPRIIR